MQVDFRVEAIPNNFNYPTEEVSWNLHKDKSDNYWQRQIDKIQNQSRRVLLGELVELLCFHIQNHMKIKPPETKHGNNLSLWDKVISNNALFQFIFDNMWVVTWPLTHSSFRHLQIMQLNRMGVEDRDTVLLALLKVCLSSSIRARVQSCTYANTLLALIL